ncbi:MAG: CHAT domain-containing protein [Cyanobacteria bacterium P01_G01_bin.54]
MKTQHPLPFAVLGCLPLLMLNAPSAQTQTLLPATDGIGTQITVEGDRIDIHGGSLSGDGANLFHSFQEFGLSEAQIANFLSQPEIENILGRVVGGNPSVINGLLQVTGGSSNLYLMNPSGILFGAHAQLNVPGDFFATTATGIGFDSGAEFKAIGSPDYSALVGTPSQFAFAGATAGAMVNAGNLTVNSGHEILLLAGQTANTGTVAAAGGRVTIAAVPGESLIRISQPDHLLSLEIVPSRTLTDELDTITALDLPALLTGADLDTGLTPTAAAEAQVNATDSRVANVSAMNLVSGEITATEVNVLGDRVSLFGAQIDASGTTGGGTVRIGGDYRGEGTIPNATHTTIDKAANIQADALDSGDGGRVIVWADDTTHFWGEISAQGVENGGFVEVSGQKNLIFPNLADVNVSGQLGNAGTLLLDPENIVVGTLGTNDAQLPTINAATGSGTFFISQTALNTALGVGNVALAATNNITFESDYTYGPSPVTSTLSLEAGGSISTQALDLDAVGSTISLAITANNDITIAGDLQTNGAVNLTAGNTISTASIGSLITPNSITIDAGRNLMINGVVGAAGNINLNSASTIQVTGTVPFSGTEISIASAGGAINITQGGALLGIPFTVGDATLNGTAGAMTNVNFTIFPTQRLANNFTFGGISVNSNQTYNPCAVTPCFPPFDLTTLDLNEFNLDDLVLVDYGFEELVSEFESSLSTEYTDYYGLNHAPTATLAEIQDYLRTIEDRVGIKSAIVYLMFSTTEVVEPGVAPATASLTKTKPGSLPAVAPTAIPQPLWEFTPDGLGSHRLAPRAQGNPQGSDRLELIVITPDQPPLRRPVPSARRDSLQALVRRFQRQVNQPTRLPVVLATAQQLYGQLIAPIQPALERQGIGHLGLIPDVGLRSLPFAALHNGDRFLIEDYSINLIPSLSLTDLTYHDLDTAPVLAMGAAQFAEQTPLPAVPLELSLIAEELRSGKAFLDQDFTITNLQQARRSQSFPIVHLATHGEFRSGRPEQSYIELWGDRLPLSEIRDLELYSPLVELLVLSACRTALGDHEAELGFAGLAVGSGARSALGSLWYVSDQGTLALMTSFYAQLAQQPTRSEALRQAQLNLLRGETRIQSGQLLTPGTAFAVSEALTRAEASDFSHPYYWSAFTMIGSPW